MDYSVEVELSARSPTGPEARFEVQESEKQERERKRRERERDWRESLLLRYEQQLLTEENETLLRENAALARELEELRVKNSELRRCLERHLPHRQIFRTSLVFLLFFSGVLTVQLLFGLQVIRSGLGWAGLGVCAGAAFLSYLAELDWRDWKSKAALPRGQVGQP